MENCKKAIVFAKNHVGFCYRVIFGRQFLPNFNNRMTRNFYRIFICFL